MNKIDTYRKIIHSITDPISDSGTPLNSIGFLHHLILNILHQLTHQLSHIKALPILKLINDSCAVLVKHILAQLLLLGEASLLYIWNTLVLVHSALYWVTVFFVSNLVKIKTSYLKSSILVESITFCKN